MTPDMIPGDLPAAWRARATMLSDGGAGDVAHTWELAASELEHALRTLGETTLNLTDAAHESGYSPQHLSYLVKRGDIPNAGRTGAPRIRRADLPTKPAGGPGRPPGTHRVPTRDDIRALSLTQESQ